ncbi:MAG: 3-phosphoshikimate 1-carboxyvinyltransferase [Actinomycetota bacterium]|nr:3-phosphoshikimate 1-carboxyvinyltransferase [Actinomycetota bacterium]
MIDPTTPDSGRAVVGPPVRSPLHGRLQVPGDKSISHRALLLAARAAGRSELVGLSTGLDVAATTAAMAAYGAKLEHRGPSTVVVTGGPALLGEPASVIDVGNSGTAIRLLAGWSAGLPALSILAGDDSVAKRPMERVVEPLRAMGAAIDGRLGGRYAPLVVRGGHLHGIDYHVPVPSAQVKGAILLAALSAEGATTVHEATPTRTHTEEMLAAAGADITVVNGAVTVRPSSLHPVDVIVPGDPSQAAFWVVAASIVAGSDLVVDHVYVGPGRAGFLAVLERMGADITVEASDDAERTADLRVRGAELVATEVGGAEVAALIDEIPVLAVAAAFARGTTVFADAAELRLKETDRIAAMTSELRAVGIDVTDRPDGLVVTGSDGEPIAGGTVHSHGDHRVAMALAVAALRSSQSVTIEGWDAVATSYPGFEEDLHRCTS